MNNEGVGFELTDKIAVSPIFLAAQWYATIASIVFIVLLINRHKMKILDSVLALYFLKPIENKDKFIGVLRASIWVVAILGVLYFALLAFQIYPIA